MRHVFLITSLQEDHALKLEKLVQDRESIGVNLDSIRDATDSKRENISKMAAQALALREKGAEYTLSSQIADSRTAYALSLYAKISNITWDYEAAPGKIAGCTYSINVSLFSLFSKIPIFISHITHPQHPFRIELYS